MKKPRPFKCGERVLAIASPLGVDMEIPIANRHRDMPKNIRRAANWLRKLADWYDHQADLIEYKSKENDGLRTC